MDPQVVRTTYEPNGDVPAARSAACRYRSAPRARRKTACRHHRPCAAFARTRPMAGIKTVAVDYRPVARQTKTVGYVTYDESRLSRVVSRVGGYVEKLFVDKTFTMVHKGDAWSRSIAPNCTARPRN